MDMVGHTGKIKETITAAETIDSNLGKIIKAVEKSDYILVITADHGNAEKMFDPKQIKRTRRIREAWCRLSLWKKD